LVDATEDARLSHLDLFPALAARCTVNPCFFQLQRRRLPLFILGGGDR